MRLLALLLVTSVAFLASAAGGSARPQTTNPGGYLTVRVTITDKGITMIPKQAPRGVTAIFLVSNQATSPRVFALGHVTLTQHRSTGFAVKLARNAQRRVIVYLDDRAALPSSVAVAGKTKVVGVFRVY